MRMITFILALYVFALATMPCTDSMVSNSVQHENELISLSDDHNHNHSHGDEEDSCPPFCACQCCGIHVLAPSPALIEKEITKVNDTYSDNYVFNYSYQFLGGIWHPPVVS